MNKIILFTIVLLCLQSHILAASSINQLTSQKTSNKVFSSLPKSSFSTIKWTHSAGIALGQTSLLGDMNNNGNNGLGFDAFYGYNASLLFNLYVNFHYSTHSNQQKTIKLPSLTMGIKKNMYHFDSITPFLMGGVGFYRPQVYNNISSDVITKSDAKTVFGINIGTGLDLQLNNQYSLNMLIHYHKPFNSKQENRPDVTGAYLNTIMGLSYLF